MVHPDRNGTHHVLFAQDGRFLQLEVKGTIGLEDAQLMTDVILPPTLVAERVLALKRLTDLMAHGALRAALYPPDPRGRRLSFVIQTVDAWLAEAPYREIAIATFGARQVERDWRDPRDHLRDRIRRAVRRGRGLMTGGYREFLR
jgi:hypothetical protein